MTARSGMWRRLRAMDASGYGGAALVVTGLGVAHVASGYPIGTMMRMGPGFAPLVLGLALAACGAAIVVAALLPRGDIDEPDRGPIRWRSMLCVLGALAVFGLLLNPAGLVPASFATVAVAMLAEARPRPLAILVYATLASGFAWLVFLRLLGLPLSAFGW